ncbi:unnamed protein product [Rangifer tarandus platyrhynchus]|uniref:Uncharacterized protein n=1 Tax=Rangifer tarandus platyrhynchus TaxID=3082113 RepID=A0ABN8XMY8_RANTA|nr:unnamed protein product [Rangifer tarandus platyrhynchus]
MYFPKRLRTSCAVSHCVHRLVRFEQYLARYSTHPLKTHLAIVLRHRVVNLIEIAGRKGGENTGNWCMTSFSGSRLVMRRLSKRSREAVTRAGGSMAHAQEGGFHPVRSGGLAYGLVERLLRARLPVHSAVIVDGAHTPILC